MVETRRNDPCPCGSGKRYKHCCGHELNSQHPKATLSTAAAALAHHRAGRLAEAEPLYQAVLQDEPENPDYLHMLGVLYYQTGRHKEAFAHILQALNITDWRIAEMRHNIGLVLPCLVDTLDSPRNRETAEHIRHYWLNSTQFPVMASTEPLVSIVIPAYNHAGYIRNALDSVYDQTYRNIELIIIDDGSKDGTDRIIAAHLAVCPFPHRFIARENRGACETINQGIALAHGDYINILNSDDRFPATRIQRMVTAIANTGQDWGFGDVSCIDQDGQPIDIEAHTRCDMIAQAVSRIRDAATVGFSLIDFNTAISTGNLFFSQRLFNQLHGFKEYRYNHDWDFCLRALWLSEPVFVPGQCYEYRLHDSNTITNAADAGRQEADAILMGYLTRAFLPDPAPNPEAPCVASWGLAYLTSITGRRGLGSLLQRDWVEILATALEAASSAIGNSESQTHKIEPRFIPNIPIPTIHAQAIAALPARPLISVLLPTYNTPLRWLARCIDSVREQIYPDWELCIADDASTDPDLRELLERYTALDSRIRVSYRTSNGHISEATNTALAMANGSYCALLDHDDELSPEALFWAARMAAAHPDLGIIYSDEDKIDTMGVRSYEHLKPDWNPELLRAQNCVCHLGVYRTDLLRQAGGFRKGFEGAQDWDVALRVSELLSDTQIRRIPRVLYHWRVIEGSTALETGQKPYVTASQRATLEEHHRRAGRRVELQSLGNTWLTRYLPETWPEIDLVIDMRRMNAAECTQRLRTLLEHTDYPALTLHVCTLDTSSFDIGSSLGNKHAIRRLALPCSLSRAELYKRLAEECTGTLFGYIDDGLIPQNNDWLSVLAGHAVLPESGACCARVLTREGRVDFAGSILGGTKGIGYLYRGQPADTPGHAWRARLPQNFAALQADHLLVDRQKMLRSGGFSDDALANWGFDIDLCLRLRRQGLRNVWTPIANLERIGRPAPPNQAATSHLKSLWSGAFDNDPSHHPRLTMEDPMLQRQFSD